MKKVVIKHKNFLCVILIFVCLTFVYSGIVEKSVSRQNGFTIIIDAGHGGRDGGSVGVNGTIEKEINLEYALMLKKKLVAQGYKVELTRKNDDGLYSATAKNKKQSDMNERLSIIKRTNPNLVISIHMNSFVNSSARGSVVYYRNGDGASKTCADLIQKSLYSYCDARIQNSKVGDYFMLNSSYYTAVLIECGFLSNPEEEKLLNTNAYKEKMTDAISKGVLLYFGNYSI